MEAIAADRELGIAGGHLGIGTRRIAGPAVLPGEIGGPALRITVEVRNDSDATIDLRTATVTAAYGDPVQPANPISKPEGKAFENEVSPGQSATGVFVFEVPADQRGYVRVDVDLSVDQPIVAFEGAVGSQKRCSPRESSRRMTPTRLGRVAVVDR